jgi:hypothetical protein
MYASIHTVEIRSEQTPDFSEADESLITKKRLVKDERTGKITNYIVVNPNNYYEGEDDEVWCYSDFEDVMTDFTETLKLHDREYSRIDIRVDCYEDRYLEYFKLNSLLTGLLSNKFTFRNNESTISMGQKTRFKNSVYLKGRLWDIEYYDKKKESQDKFPCKARLEFRLRLNRQTRKAIPDVVALLFDRLENLDTYYDECLENFNNHLYTHYKWVEEHEPLKGRKDNVTPYVKENQDAFFSRKQIREFCKMCEIKNYEGRANDIVRRTGIELISRKNVREYIAGTFVPERIKKGAIYMKTNTERIKSKNISGIIISFTKIISEFP